MYIVKANILSFVRWYYRRGTVADPDISFGRGTKVERQRREDGGAKGAEGGEAW